MKTDKGELFLTRSPASPGVAIINNDPTAGILCGMRCLDIIRAVNSHDDLLEACEAVSGFLKHGLMSTDEARLMKLLTQAISKAKGEDDDD